MSCWATWHSFAITRELQFEKSWFVVSRRLMIDSVIYIFVYFSSNYRNFIDRRNLHFLLYLALESEYKYINFTVHIKFVTVECLLHKTRFDVKRYCLPPSCCIYVFYVLFTEIIPPLEHEVFLF